MAIKRIESALVTNGDEGNKTREDVEIFLKELVKEKQ